MQRLVVCLFLFVCTATSQPMSGNYTVGGNLPDFLTPQAAANALKQRGVSSPVFINIRPGTYIRQGAVGVVMRMDTVVAGVSPTNRITFQPDIATGGNPTNVILQIDCDITVTQGADRVVVFLGTDYVTLRNLTFRDADSLDTPAAYLVRMTPVVFANPTIEGVVVEGCTFIGSQYYTHGQQFGTDMGMYQGGGLISARISNCRFTNLMRAISIDLDSDPPGDSLVVEGNRFDHLYSGATGAGTPLGTAIEMRCAHPIVQRNFVNQSAGSIGIQIVFPVSGLLSRNYVQGSFANGQITVTPPSAGPDRTDSFTVSNNITLGSGLFSIRTRRTRLLHNTIIYSGGNTGLQLLGTNCSAINNILLVYGGFVAYDQLGAAGLVSDHNVLFSTATHLVRTNAGSTFGTLTAYQTATGLDPNSHFTDISFSTDSLGIHLDECQAQNSDLDGTPLREVPIDFYGARRDTIKPFIGAVEGVRLPYNMFAAPFKTALPGFAVSIAAGKFDNTTTSGIAVPDYDNRQVFLYHNNGAGRTFSHTGTLATGFRPVEVRFVDFDADNNLDLIVGGDTNAVKIYWGNGSGGFSSPTTVGTLGRVRSLEPAYVSGQRANTIWITQDNGFVPTASYLGDLVNLGSRQLCHDVTYRLDGINYVHDTIPASMTALAVGDFDTTSGFEIATLAFDFAPRFMMFHPVESLFATPCASNGRLGVFSTHTANQFGTGAFLGFGSDMAVGDFDGDGDKDFVTVGASENKCVFIRNQGVNSFTIDTIPTSATRGVVALDYENDGDLDFVTVNRTLDSLGITIFLNDGTGHFAEKKNCYFPFASGWPDAVVASDFDLDGKKDIAVVSRTIGGFDSLFVLYNLGGFNGTTGVETPHPAETPDRFALMQNYPNPFNPSTRIDYILPTDSRVTISVYNLLGQEIATLVHEDQLAGYHTTEWSGRSSHGMPLSTGVYFCRMDATTHSGLSFTNFKKMLLLK